MFAASLLLIERRLRAPDRQRGLAPPKPAGACSRRASSSSGCCTRWTAPRRRQPAELGALRTRFDLFWSRVEALRSAATARPVRTLPGAAELLRAAAGDAASATPERSSRQPDPLSCRAAVRISPATRTPLQRADARAPASARPRRTARCSSNLRELRPTGWLSLAGLLGSAGILIFLLCREIRNTRRLLARTEESRDRIEHLAHHDALTGLPNRRLFEDRLIQALAVAARARRRLALLYLDLDGFKEINDSLGHRAGDELLRVVAERLATTVRGGDTIARLGGDEFAVIQIELRTATDAAILAERLMAAAAKPMRVGQQDVVIGASVGIALFPDDGGTADELRANADVALYSAKAAGRARMAYYRPELTTEARTRGLLRRDLARGIEEGELELHYQPKVAAADGSVTGLEALLRWQHPQRGTAGPRRFPAAGRGDRPDRAPGRLGHGRRAGPDRPLAGRRHRPAAGRHQPVALAAAPRRHRPPARPT